MSAPHLKFTYFDYHGGRGRLVRLALSFGSVGFVDDTIQEEEQWPSLKPKTPLGQLPVLEINGEEYCQSLAIARYAARLTGLYPSDPLDALKVDMIIDSIGDAYEHYVDMNWHTPDQVVQKAKIQEFTDTKLPKLLTFLESRVQGKFFQGDTPTLADLRLFDVISDSFAPYLADNDMPEYPKLKNVVEAVQALPTIAKYLAKTN